METLFLKNFILNELEIKISQRIHEFDLISLIRLLKFIGYQDEEIRFKSNVSISSQPTLIHGIEFRNEQPSRRVIIIVNLGLLSAQNPLPNYFLKKMDDRMIDTQAFVDFIGYFDHCLIKNYLLNIYPEINANLFRDWELTKLRYLQMLDLKSRSVLHWLFQLVFPELSVCVKKVVLQRKIKTASIQLGKTVIGSEAVFGKKTSVPVYGKRITLHSERELTDFGEPWPKEIKKRINDLIFPIIESVGIDMEIILIIRSQTTWAKLHRESYLGYDKIQGGKESYRQIRIMTKQAHCGDFPTKRGD